MAGDSISMLAPSATTAVSASERVDSTLNRHRPFSTRCPEAVDRNRRQAPVEGLAEAGTHQQAVLIAIEAWTLACLSTAPCGMTPCLRYRHSAIRSRLASARTPTCRMRLPGESEQGNDPGASSKPGGPASASTIAEPCPPSSRHSTTECAGSSGIKPPPKFPTRTSSTVHRVLHSKVETAVSSPGHAELSGSITLCTKSAHANRQAAVAALPGRGYDSKT
jgi:hypothetical protein